MAVLVFFVAAFVFLAVVFVLLLGFAVAVSVAVVFLVGRFFLSAFPLPRFCLLVLVVGSFAALFVCCCFC